MTPDVAPVTAALADLIADVTAAAVGDGKLPQATDPPFAVVYWIGGDTWGPPLVAPDAAAAIDYQVTSVAISRAGAEAHADAVRHAILDRTNGAFTHPLAVAGLAVFDREFIGYGGVDEDRGVFNARDNFRIHVTLT